MLRELTIQNYRCFENFHVKDLAHVNLIVGKNNVGKTSLLEAIYLYVGHGNAKNLLEILSSRNLTYEQRLHGGETYIHNYYPVNDFFHHHLDYVSNHGSKGDRLTTLQSDNEILKLTLEPWNTMRSYFTGEGMPAFELVFSWMGKITIYPVNSSLNISSNVFQNPIVEGTENNQIVIQPNHFIDSRGLGFEALRLLWDEINLTPEEEYVEQAMQLLEPRLERIGFTRQSYLSGVKIRLEGNRNPIAMSSLGDGMRRMLGIAMALSVAKSGYLVIDEIDMGLHYEVQESMWRLVLETAKRLNVQVFATTHSWDCISAFQSALEEMADPAIGKLFRIDPRGDEVRAIEYDADELEVAVSHGIEVR
jgi:hypothetical protein